MMPICHMWKLRLGGWARGRPGALHSEPESWGGGWRPGPRAGAGTGPVTHGVTMARTRWAGAGRVLRPEVS